MNQNENNLINNNNTSKSQPDNKTPHLDFWNFEALRDPRKYIPKKSAFPEDRVVPRKEMDFYLEKLSGRMSRYKDSKCYNYLEGYLNFIRKVYESKNEEEMKKSYDNSLKSLKLFTFCWDSERQENLAKSLSNKS